MFDSALIPSPRFTQDDPDRHIICKQALEPFFKELAASAQRAGWDGDEVAMALFSIAVADMKDRESKRRTNWSSQRSLAALDRIAGHTEAAITQAGGVPFCASTAPER